MTKCDEALKAAAAREVVLEEALRPFVDEAILMPSPITDEFWWGLKVSAEVHQRALDALADTSPAAAALLAKVEAQDADLTEIATTMTEHFDSVDLNDLPVSLTKGIRVLLAQGEALEKLGTATARLLIEIEDEEVPLTQALEAKMRAADDALVPARAALAPGEEKE